MLQHFLNRRTQRTYPSKQDDPEYWRAIKIRLGQLGFRKALLAAYGGKCAISGCGVEQLLDAAHVKPYSDYGRSANSNGILLRTDLHVLFDRGLLKIDPETRKIMVHESIKDSAYRKLHGKPVSTPTAKGDQIEKAHLLARWKQEVRLGN